jgi:hypothetical protein
MKFKVIGTPEGHKRNEDLLSALGYKLNLIKYDPMFLK